MQLGIVQLWSGHHSSLGMRYPFLVAFEQGEQHGGELAGDAANYFALATILPRALVIDAFARRQVGVEAGELIVGTTQGLPDHQVEGAFERSHSPRRQPGAVYGHARLGERGRLAAIGFELRRAVAVGDVADHRQDGSRRVGPKPGIDVAICPSRLWAMMWAISASSAST
jgi:hypothetical protein